MGKSTKKFWVVICIVIVGLCIVLPSAYRSIQIHSFVNKLIGSTWVSPAFSNKDFYKYQFIDENTVVCTDVDGDKHLGEWKVTDFGKTSTDLFKGIKGKSVTIFVSYTSAKESGWDKVYTSNVVMIYDSQSKCFRMYEQPGDSATDMLIENVQP